MGKGPESWPRPLAVALSTSEPWAAGPRREPGAKVSWAEFRGGASSCRYPGAEGGEGSRHRCRAPWPQDLLSQVTNTLFSRTCDSSSGSSSEGSRISSLFVQVD